jgi:hypothetical protein
LQCTPRRQSVMADVGRGFNIPPAYSRRMREHGKLRLFGKARPAGRSPADIQFEVAGQPGATCRERRRPVAAGVHIGGLVCTLAMPVRTLAMPVRMFQAPPLTTLQALAAEPRIGP